MILTKRLDNETETHYIWRMGQAKDMGEINLNWIELAEIMNTQLFDDESEYVSDSVFRKMYRTAKRFYDELFLPEFQSEENVDEKLQKQIEELRKERIKTQTANLERNRIERNDARKELYYETIGRYVQALDVPEFKRVECGVESDEHYLLTLADIHYGATFSSLKNTYSREIAKERLEILADKTIEFIKKHKVTELSVANLGDCVQGILRVSDLRINDTSVVKCIVEVSHLLAEFLNALSKYAYISYYHVPSANHAQTRPLGTKASELADEDVEYIISHYIMDLCANNERISVHVAEDDEQFIVIPVGMFDVYAVHGHQYKGIEQSLRNLSFSLGEMVDYVLMGHFHNAKEISSHEMFNYDAEVLVCPSIIGSDPYSDRIGKGTLPSAKIFGFNNSCGHDESYKFILN